ncbi:MAG: NADH-quinone oxidoreductase subunit M [Chloroflexota bacterium]
MDFILDNLLLLILLSPLFGMVVILLIPGDEKKLIRWTAFLFSLVPLALSLVLWINYDIGVPGFQFEHKATWYAPLNASFHLGVDGISVSMVLLTTILAPLAILASFNIKERVRMYMALFLLLEVGMLGVFMSLDLIVFFLFWEVGLVPMYFLINQWGSDNRRYASIKFILYTMAGSLGLLLAIQVMGLSAGTFSIPVLGEIWPAMEKGILGMSASTVKAVGFWAFTVAFAIKVPIWPFHTWLPDAHTEAPTAGSMILAGVLLKLGAYGFIRLVLPLFPEQAYQAAWIIGLFGMFSVIFGAYASYGQTDFKRLIAYSSVNHMGFVVLGIAVAARVGGSIDAGLAESSVIALNGAVLQMFNHGLSAAALFFLVGVIYERTHTRDLNKYGGLWTVMPAYGGILIFCAMASVGLPGLNGFVSEFMVVRGAWSVYAIYTALAMIGLLLTGAYLLKALRLVLHGSLNQEWKQVTEISVRERLVVYPLMALMLSIGLWPRWVLEVINATVTRLVG